MPSKQVTFAFVFVYVFVFVSTFDECELCWQGLLPSKVAPVAIKRKD